jgi:prepilin-type N-terminal cleavage/methylation domain-containing protein
VNLKNKGFTIIELLIVLAIIGILSSVVFGSLKRAKDRAYYMKAQVEYKSMAEALEFYKDDNGDYPPDANRNIPPGIEVYLSGEREGNWPNAPWPGSVYDWDNWDDPDNYGEKIYQISIRFCPMGGPIESCSFPNEDWAEGFLVNSSAYYCISGNCRSHRSESVDYPGYCINCQN